MQIIAIDSLQAYNHLSKEERDEWLSVVTPKDIDNWSDSDLQSLASQRELPASLITFFAEHSNHILRGFVIDSNCSYIPLTIIQKLANDSNEAVRIRLGYRLYANATRRAYGDSIAYMNVKNYSFSSTAYKKEVKIVQKILYKMATHDSIAVRYAIANSQELTWLGNINRRRIINKLLKDESEIIRTEAIRSAPVSRWRIREQIWKTHTLRAEYGVISNPNLSDKLIQRYWNERKMTTAQTVELEWYEQVLSKFTHPSEFGFMESVTNNPNTPPEILDEIITLTIEHKNEHTWSERLLNNIARHQNVSDESLIRIFRGDFSTWVKSSMWSIKNWVTLVCKKYDLPEETPIDWMQELVTPEGWD